MKRADGVHCPITWMLLGVLVSAAAPPPAAQSGLSAFPGRLDSYLTNAAKLTADERRRVIRGEPFTKLLEADANKEIAVLGVVWINASIRRYVDAIKDIERFERGGGFKVTKRISAPPKLDDFSQLRLPDEDVADLRTCRVGDCEVKLSAQALERFRAEIDWRAPDARAAANALMQRLTFEYVLRYLEGGNEQLAVYRDDSRPTFVAQQFLEMVDQMPELTTYMPDMRQYLLEYPRMTIPDAISFLYWQETEFGLKPTIRISHVTILENTDNAVVTSKMLYASHYFWTGLEVRALIADPARGSGFWFVTVNRSRSDGLSGFSGMFVRRRVRSEVQKGALAGLRSTKEMLERAR